MLRLYDATVSGNCYKVRLALAQLGRPYERIEFDVLGDAPPPAELLRLNPQGKVPVLVLDDGRPLVESGAILWQLADGTALLPSDPDSRMQVLRWLFFEQNEHEPTVAVCRNLSSYSGEPERYAAVLEFLRPRGERTLAAMEAHLASHAFFVGERYSIADIALYAYTHAAGEGGFDLGRHPAVRSWLLRVREQSGHVPLRVG